MDEPCVRLELHLSRRTGRSAGAEKRGRAPFVLRVVRRNSEDVVVQEGKRVLAQSAGALQGHSHRSLLIDEEIAAGDRGLRAAGGTTAGAAAAATAIARGGCASIAAAIRAATACSDEEYARNDRRHCCVESHL